MHSKLGSILSEIDDSYYYVDTAPLKNLDLKKINAVNVKIKNSNLCGEYLLKLQRPQSWTWFSSKITPPLNTYKLIRINFKCYDK